MAPHVVLLGVLGLGLVIPGASQPEALQSKSMSPIEKVLTLIEEMKRQAEKDAADDEANFNKYMCWCTTNRDDKEAAVKIGNEEIADLTNFIAQAAATEAQLKTDIATLADDIAADKDALATATAVREKENAEFKVQHADLTETHDLLAEAIDVLSKVQLLQKKGGQAKAREVLMQLQNKVRRSNPGFASVIQKDLFDVMGAFQETTAQLARSLRHNSELSPNALVGEVFFPSNEATALQQVEQPTGMAAGSKSYNSRSGNILGMLGGMKDEVARDLAAAEKTESTAAAQFEKLKAAKIGEITAAQKQKDQKEADLADIMDRAAKAKEDKAAMEEAVEADQSFLANLEKNCAHEDAEYKKRVNIRNEELRALAETIKILTTDDARDLFGKTIYFMQTKEERANSEDRRAERAMQRIAQVAKKHKDWALVSLAVRVRLDAFTKVKALIDKMMTELKQQQKNEDAKRDTCNKDIDATEDKIKEGEQTKEDLGDRNQDLKNTIATLTNEIDELKREVADMQVSLKRAGEDRKAQNALFQVQISEQRATINILNKALARLKDFYTPKESLAEISVHGHQVPGARAPPPPAAGRDYQKSGGAGGVLQLLAKIISEAETETSEIQLDEQHAQTAYASFVQDVTSSVEADRQAIQQKEIQRTKAESDKSETQENQLANNEELSTLADLLKAHHVDCDFLIKYFEIRKQARADELESMADAKAILSGANFGQ